MNPLTNENAERKVCDMIKSIISGNAVAAGSNIPEFAELFRQTARDWNRDITVNGIRVL